MTTVVTSSVGMVAVVGRPNTGKSTLMNQILGSELSIVSPKAQTTRDRIFGVFTEPLPNGTQGQMIFIDTPGIHQAKEGGVNSYMVSQVRETLRENTGEVVWYLVDPNSCFFHEQIVLELLKNVKGPVFLIINKEDLIRGEEKNKKIQGFIQELSSYMQNMGLQFKGVHFISALHQTGIENLLRETWSLLPKGPLLYPDPDQLSDRPTRFFVAEMIREQLFLQLEEELPYCCAVEIVNFKESSPIRIEAVIYVERESQKGIVIGNGGAKIKSIGQAARKKIEAFLDVPSSIFLGLQVKLLKDWTRKEESLKYLGYTLKK